MNYNPIRRTPLCRVKRHGKKERGDWHPQVVRLGSAGMATLRSEAFARSRGLCEAEDCGERVSYFEGQLHHVQARGKGGSDVISNVVFLCRPCHAKIHGVPEWSKRV